MGLISAAASPLGRPKTSPAPLRQVTRRTTILTAGNGVVASSPTPRLSRPAILGLWYSSIRPHWGATYLFVLLLVSGGKFHPHTTFRLLLFERPTMDAPEV